MTIVRFAMDIRLSFRKERRGFTAPFKVRDDFICGRANNRFNLLTGFDVAVSSFWLVPDQLVRIHERSEATSVHRPAWRILGGFEDLHGKMAFPSPQRLQLVEYLSIAELSAVLKIRKNRPCFGK